MKKIYINPELEIIEIQTTGMLAASVETGIYTGGDVDAPSQEEPNMFGW